MTPHKFYNVTGEGAGGRGDKVNELIDMQETWDEFSEHIDSDIDSLQMFAGSSVITHRQFERMFNKIKGMITHLSPSPFPPISHDIVSFWDEVLKKPIPCPDESRYFEWCYWMLKNEHPVHQIQLENEVDKVVYTVGDKTENGEIKSLHWRGNYWSYKNEKGDGISIDGPIKGDDYHRDGFRRKAEESSSLHNKKSNNNE